jgi:hypothetical protein
MLGDVSTRRELTKALDARDEQAISSPTRDCSGTCLSVLSARLEVVPFPVYFVLPGLLRWDAAVLLQPL